MSLLGLNTKDLPDLELPTEEEHSLQIISAKLKDSKSSDRKLISLAIKITDADVPTANVFHNIVGTLPDDDEDKVYTMNSLAKNVEVCFDIDLESPTVLEDAIGATGFGIIVYELYDEINRAKVGTFLAPR